MYAEAKGLVYAHPICPLLFRELIFLRDFATKKSPGFERACGAAVDSLADVQRFYTRLLSVVAAERAIGLKEKFK